MDWLKNIMTWPLASVFTLAIIIVIYLFFFLNKPTIKHYTYKTTPQGNLELKVYLPKNESEKNSRPVILFFFGGGWIGGGINHFQKQAEYFATRGIVATLVEYRVDSKHRTTPDKAVEDGLDAIQWVADHANELGIDTQKIIASGASAGGHIAACLALCKIRETDVLSDIQPSLLVLFNPVLDLMNATAELEFMPRELELIDAIGPNKAHAISPNQHINEHTPDTLIIFGENDPLLEQTYEFIPAAKKNGAEIRLLIAKNNGHGFCNKDPWKSSSIRAMDQYLIEKGYLSGEPFISEKISQKAPFHLINNTEE